MHRLPLSKHAGLLRSRDSHARVTFVELFFDLVFVFAVTQLSHTLVAHMTLAGALQTSFLLLAVWWVWMYTCWFTNWIDPDKPAVRMLLFALMLAGLMMSAAILRSARGLTTDHRLILPRNGRLPVVATVQPGSIACAARSSGAR